MAIINPFEEIKKRQVTRREEYPLTPTQDIFDIDTLIGMVGEEQKKVQELHGIVERVAKALPVLVTMLKVADLGSDHVAKEMLEDLHAVLIATGNKK